MSGGSPRPIYLLAGGTWRGRKERDALLVPVLAQAGNSRPSIAYVGAASEDDPGFFRWISAYLKRAGAGEVRLVPLASSRADPGEARTILAGSDLVFVSGGDVEAGIGHLEQRGVIPYLRQLHRDGKPFFGLSAGSIMLARCWIRWADPADDSSCQVFPCLGLASILCDTHAESDDWEELEALLALGDPGVGYGIPSGAALRVDPSGDVAALGRPVHRLERRSTGVVRIEDLAPLER